MIRRGPNNDLLILGVAFAGLYLGVFKPLLEALGLKDTKEEKDAERLKQQTEGAAYEKDYWNPGYIAGRQAMLLTDASARALTKQLWDAAGIFNDDEEQIYAVFRSLKYRSQVAFLAFYFAKLYKKDLYTWLRDSVLNKEELATVLSITNKLPSGL